MSADFERTRALRHAATAAALMGGGARAAFPARPKEHVVRIASRKFAFLPREVTVKKGEPVVFELTSADVIVAFSLPDFNIRTDIVPGKKSRLRFTPDKEGSFTFLCGEGHEGMNGTLTVTA